MKRLLVLTLLPSLCLSVASAQPGRGFQQGRRPGQGFQQRGGGRSSGGSRPGTPGSATLERAGVKTVIHGPFTFAPDGNPLVGPVPGLRIGKCCAKKAIFPNIMWAPAR